MQFLDDSLHPENQDKVVITTAPYGPLFLGLVILIVACINYVNLTTAKASLLPYEMPQRFHCFTSNAVLSASISQAAAC